MTTLPFSVISSILPLTDRLRIISIIYVCLSRISIPSLYNIVGIPLPLFGMLAYGTVAVFGGLQLTEQKLPFVSNGVGRFVLLGLTTSMAAASAYLLYILSTQFSGVLSCSYCLFSACLSFSLFFIILKVRLLRLL